MIFNFDVSELVRNTPSLDLVTATVIPDSTDYNTLTTPGNYVCLSSTSGTTMTNAPTSAAHKLYVLHNVADNRITQIALVNSATAKLLLRTYTTSGWSSWSEPSYRVQSQLTSNVEVDNTATKSYSAGDFVAVNANLYKVIASIANGGTITTGTNVSTTTVTSELKSLNSFADGLGGIKRFSFGLASNTTRTYNIPSSVYGLFMSFGTAGGLLELALYRTNSSGSVIFSQVFNATGLTITRATNKLTVANTSSNATQIIFLTMNTHTITVDS